MAHTHGKRESTVQGFPNNEWYWVKRMVSSGTYQDLLVELLMQGGRPGEVLGKHGLQRRPGPADRWGGRVHHHVPLHRHAGRLALHWHAGWGAHHHARRWGVGHLGHGGTLGALWLGTLVLVVAGGWGLWLALWGWAGHHVRGHGVRGVGRAVGHGEGLAIGPSAHHHGHHRGHAVGHWVGRHWPTGVGHPRAEALRGWHHHHAWRGGAIGALGRLLAGVWGWVLLGRLLLLLLRRLWLLLVRLLARTGLLRSRGCLTLLRRWGGRLRRLRDGRRPCPHPCWSWSLYRLGT